MDSYFDKYLLIEIQEEKMSEQHLPESVSFDEFPEQVGGKLSST